MGLNANDFQERKASASCGRCGTNEKDNSFAHTPRLGRRKGSPGCSPCCHALSKASDDGLVIVRPTATGGAGRRDSSTTSSASSSSSLAQQLSTPFASLEAQSCLCLAEPARDCPVHSQHARLRAKLLKSVRAARSFLLRGLQLASVGCQGTTAPVPPAYAHARLSAVMRH